MGKTQEIEQEVEVIDCTEGLLVGWVYASLDGDGVWYYDMSSATWTERNNGLTGSALNVNSIALRPGDKRLPNTVHQLYAATDGGVFRTHNGGRSWEQILLPDPSNAEFADAPAATVDELVFHKVVYSLEDPELLWVLASKASPARIWVYSTSNGGVDWTSRGLLA
ncbi:MAG: WD40/YVTN/BNR-like repeat-containing protein [Candidatus Thorarchaeota archaeon]